MWDSQRYAIWTGSMNNPMAKHFIQAKHGSDSNLKVIGKEHVTMNIRGRDRLRPLKQRETYWIHTLNALSYPGLNEDINFSSFL